MMATTEGRNRSRERSFSGNYGSNRTRSTSNSRLRSGSRPSTNRDRIRCYYCREYDHFMRDCPTSRKEREIEQSQQMLNLEEDQIHLCCNKYAEQSSRKSQSKSFKLMNCRHGTTTFLPLDSKIGGQINYNRPSVGQFLTREQASYVYRKTESGEIINVDTIQQEIEQKKQLNKINGTSGDTNPYKELNSKQCRGIRAINDTNRVMVNFKQCFKLHTT